MKRKYLINSAYLSIMILIFTFLKSLGYSSAAMLRQDVVFYLIYIPMSLSLPLFSIFYVALGTKWSAGIRESWTSVCSILLSLIFFAFSIFLPNFYDTFSFGLQAIVISVILFLDLVLIPFVVIEGKRRNKKQN